MKLLLDLDVVAGNRLRARPGDYLRSLPHAGQVAVVSEFLHLADKTRAEAVDPQARAEAGIGIATAREFLQKLPAAAPQIYAGRQKKDPHD